VTLPAIRRICSSLAFALVAGTAAAQTALPGAAEGRVAPGGAVIIALRPGAMVSSGSSKGTDVLVTIEGWVATARLSGKLDTFPASVDANGTLRVRASPEASGAIVAELRPRTGVHTLGKSGTWTRIRRSVWVPAGALHKAVAHAVESKPPAVAPAAKASPAPPPASATATDASVAPPVAPAGPMSVSKPTKLLAAPDGSAMGDLTAGTIVQPIAHDHGWAKVRIEGWVPERELTPADSAAGSRLTAADLRADPDGTRGKIVQWEVEILSLQTADPLRPDLARDEPYLLAKGPGTEDALLYLAIPPSLLNQAKALAPLSRVLITARVRVGHSEPGGTPILDLRSISKR
jgi:hypothetical protein